ncbi:MAG: hypothetical protein MUF54_21820 [Polyangiaceae bacterium]|nr:hypothetical protein [Polyangiaceae bacterium]
MHEVKPTCGPHTELVKTGGIRITRCPCGTVHVGFARNGVTIQLGVDQFAEVAQAMALAKAVMAGQGAEACKPATPIGAGRFITLSPFDPRKPSN